MADGAIASVPTSASSAQRRCARLLAVVLEHPAAMYLASLAPGSRPGMASTIKIIASFFASTPAELDWSALTFSHVTALRSHLAEISAPATGNKALCALRGVLRFAVRLGKMDRLAMLNAIDVPPIRGHREAPGRSLSAAEILSMVSVCDGSRGALDVRDRALLALLFGGGLRRDEVARLNVEHVRDGLARGDGCVELLIRGKGDKARMVPLPEGTRRAIECWLEVRGDAGGGLFLRIARGTLTRNRLSRSGIYYVLKQLAQRAGVTHFSPHDLRRTYIGDLFDAAVDVSTIQALVGHASPATTTRYDRRPVRVRRVAASKIVFPF